mmetsp:Transcript_2635/g.3947  ORF Transcript_2635/g.3947 Transcript_2635/m.3947 type:complete len:110 (-) Transcript_2635:165-494(-)
MRGSPRRDAVEYGILMFCATSLSAGLGLMLYMRRTDGLDKLDLTAPVDIQGSLKQLKQLRYRALASGGFGNVNGNDNGNGRGSHDGGNGNAGGSGSGSAAGSTASGEKK